MENSPESKEKNSVLKVADTMDEIGKASPLTPFFKSASKVVGVDPDPILERYSWRNSFLRWQSMSRVRKILLIVFMVVAILLVTWLNK